MIKKVRNWGDYNKALVCRGSLLFAFEKNYLSTLYYPGVQARGGVRIYAPGMYEYLLLIKVSLRLSWRMTVGFARGLLEKAFSDVLIDIPDYAHASRVCQRLPLKLKQFVKPPADGLILAFDGTGVNVYSTSG